MEHDERFDRRARRFPRRRPTRRRQRRYRRRSRARSRYGRIARGNAAVRRSRALRYRSARRPRERRTRPCVRELPQLGLCICRQRTCCIRHGGDSAGARNDRRLLRRERRRRKRTVARGNPQLDQRGSLRGRNDTRRIGLASRHGSVPAGSGAARQARCDLPASPKGMQESNGSIGLRNVRAVVAGK